MADIVPSHATHRKLIIPRVDLTPMVDLGFLLITFFMFTTTLARPKTMAMNMPDRNNAAQSKIPEEATITLIPAAGHRILYYAGAINEKTHLNSCGLDGNNSLRMVLMNLQEELQRLPANYSKEAHLAHVLIKPDKQSKYEDLVQVLDEMSILEVPYYFIMDLSAAEKVLVANGNYK